MSEEVITLREKLNSITNKYDKLNKNFKNMDTYVEENFKVFAKNFETIPSILDSKMDKTEFSLNKIDSDKIDKLRKSVESKADYEWVKKM